MSIVTIKEKLKSGQIVTHKYKERPSGMTYWKGQVGKKLWAGKGGKILSVKFSKTPKTNNYNFKF